VAVLSQDVLLGIDIGTLGCRCGIFDLRGNVQAYTYDEYRIESPRPGYAEQNPDTYLAAAMSTARRAMRNGRINKKDVVAIGLTGIQVSIVLLDSKGRCLGPAIIYADERSREQVEWMRDAIGERRIYEITGARLDAQYPASKLRWIKENEPGRFKRIWKILSPKDYVAFRLTGQVKMDFAMASTMQLLETRTASWSTHLAEALGIPLEILPELVPSTEILGETDAEFSRKLGVRRGTPIVTGGGDSTCMALGAGMLTERFVCGSLGATSNVFGCLDEPRLDPQMRVSYYRHVVPGKWVIMAGTNDSLVLRWYRDNLGRSEVEAARKAGVSAYKIIDQEAEKSSPGANGIVFLPFLTGARSPLWNPNATGVLFGLKYYHSRSDIVRALLESVAYSFRHRMEVLRELRLEPKETRLIGGGAKSRLWARILADVTGMPVSKLRNEEAAVFGACILAGMATKVYKSFHQACRDVVKLSTRIVPERRKQQPYETTYRLYRKVYNNLLDVFENHAHSDS
jgi:xylulokinase